ncbi:hypothetical protein QBC42DRAFT_328958 [Cladorrhinum samala]|uniref:Uncharacterized protein n=1 Tax=Cladorrhinum samala TaxID=585594 RepID=A0AAV9HNY2_9PEZI|nr:hypothetical protein QBC42DRAFT_328958 [Cladorrhinum samala]
MAARLALFLLATANVIQAKSVCSQWCKENFPAGRGCNPCTSLANKSTGPCYECGPLSLHPEKQLCGGVCIDTSADNTNCGSCGTTCSADQACTAGACVNNEPECKAPFVLCNGACIDTSTDNANCGSCGNICSANQTCTAGACVTNERNCENPFVCGSMPTSCGNGGPEADCMCFATARPGVSLCLDAFALAACSSTACASDEDCSADRICISTCCGMTCGLKSAAVCTNAAAPAKLFRKASLDELRANLPWLNKHASS